ncbi:MAG TPA: hypothetical protein VFR18_19310 [Terriglobia bacterium]|nr:hypothetical protein [Terriglobia bacterium]
MEWNELLKNYGPFALLPFTVFVIEKLAFKRVRDTNLPKTVRNTAYAAAWITIFALCGLVVFFWYSLLPAPKEAMIRGKVTGLPILNTFRASGPDMANFRVFTYRDPQQTDQLFWRAYSVDPLAESTTLSILIDHTTPTSEMTWRFHFSTKKQYYDPSMELNFVFDPKEEALKLMNHPSGQPETLKGERVVVDASPASGRLPRLPWFGTVAAQTTPSASATIANLESSDSLVRLTARRQLATLGPTAAKDMDRALSAPGASYRTKLGVIVAANQMPGFRQEQFGLSAWCEVWASAQTGDATLKDQANQLLRKRSPTLTAAQCSRARAATVGVSRGVTKPPITTPSPAGATKTSPSR